MMLAMSQLKHCRPRTQINDFIISSIYTTRSCSYSSKKTSSMVLLNLFTKRCLLSTTSTQGIIVPFNATEEFSSLSSVLSNSPLSGGISGYDDRFLSTYGSSYPSSYLKKKSYPVGQMMTTRTFATGKKSRIWTSDLTDQLIILAVKFNQNGYMDWVNIANELGNGLTNVQCKSRYRKLIEQGRIMSHKAEYMSTSYTPDPNYSYDVDVVKAFNTQPKKKNLPKKNGLWSTLMDDRLEQGVKRYGNDWVSVAAYVDSNVNNESCRNRWTKHFKPKIDGYREDAWTLEEYHQLKDLVLIHSDTVNLTGSLTFRPSIDWATISGIIKRSSQSCKNKWETIYNQRWKKLNPYYFTKEEDEFLIQSVIEAYKNTSVDKLCYGGWVTLGKKLNRDPDAVRKRFKNILLKDPRVILLLENIEKKTSE